MASSFYVLTVSTKNPQLPTHPQGGGPAKPAVLVGQSEANVSLNRVEIAAAAPLAGGHCNTPFRQLQIRVVKLSSKRSIGRNVCELPGLGLPASPR